ncbi:DUF3467 domain-containing protein [bacterium]|nr:MAG: DUF3467 domain-containing protein [bacterium]
MGNASPQQRKLEIELPEEIGEGIYANLVLIAHSPSEFVFDFVRMVPGVQKSRVQSRIIMTPLNAKNLMKALEKNVEKYESQFGEIKQFAERQEKTIGFTSQE